MRILASVVVMVALVVAGCSKPQATPKEYAYPDWRFAVTFPATPKTAETAGSADGSTSHSFLAHASMDGGYDFAVNVIDASNASTTKDEMLAGAPDAVANSTQLDVGAVSDVTLGTRPGKQVVFEKDGKPVMLMRFFFAFQKFYEVSATIPQNSVTDSKSLAFLNSFHLTGLAGAAPAPAAGNSAAPDNSAQPAGAGNSAG
jgi:hypothetical protein